MDAARDSRRERSGVATPARIVILNQKRERRKIVRAAVPASPGGLAGARAAPMIRWMD
jgi:hypothetical protein